MTHVDLGELPRTIAFDHEDGVTARFVDQRALPEKLEYVVTNDWREVVDAIKTLAVRGAPAIGAAGAIAVALWLGEQAPRDVRAPEFGEELERACDVIGTARPTAVNLRWAVAQAESAIDDALARGANFDEVAESVFGCVDGLLADDERVNRAIGQHGSALLGPESNIITHCNAGSLATVFYGTALGVVYAAAEQGKVQRVYADETRPVLQGARLTAWELARAGVPVTLICDNMAASLMARGGIDAVIVGADRIARNGDAANKIGTYGLAILAAEHGVPFYVAAPTSTIDPDIRDGSRIVIEQRAASEVLARPIEGVDVWNPAFDVTPARLIAKIITEKGAWSPDELAMRL